MKIILLAIVMCCTSLSVVKKKLWLCVTIVEMPTEIVHVPRVIAASNYNEARKKYLDLLMYRMPSIKGGVINTQDSQLWVREITEDFIID